ncbi:MAG TPA: hypothetical protein VJ201_01270 [Candidatus Babeliales bacterium]|nr:hypothetical protein [Candidatus Babeliales bacterium]
MEKLSVIAHPVKGIRFSPYSFVDISNDIVITANPLVDIFDDEKKYLWGAYDGSGEPIELTFNEYFTQFIYDKDFANAKMVSYNASIVKGNRKNNIHEVYPNSTFVEYHFPGYDPKYEGMDWKSLRLVFEEKDNVWYLIAIVHDQWTI